MLSFVATPPLVVEAVLSARQEARVRTVPDPGVTFALDTETTPAATLQLRERMGRAWISYAPRLTLRNIAYNVDQFVLHNGSVGVSRNWRRVTLSLQQDVSYGTQNFVGGPLATSVTEPGATPQPRLDLLPAAQTIGFLGFQTSLVGSYVPARRWGLRTALSYGSAGGDSDVARTVLPRTYGPRASLDVSYAVARRHGLVMGTAFQKSTISPGLQSTIISLSAGWAYLLARRTTAGLSAGASLVKAQLDASRPEDTNVLPLASATVTHRPGTGRSAGRYTAATSIAPFVDRLTGSVDVRIDGSLSVAWPLGPRTTLGTIGGFGRTLGTAAVPPTTLVLAEVSVGYAPRRWIRFDTGVRGTYQHIEGPRSALFSPSQVGLFAGIAVLDTIQLLP